jgi:hypothetical protein
VDILKFVGLAVSPALLTVAVLWLTKNLILTRLVRSVQYEFDMKLESVRSELRSSEESYKNALRNKEVEIGSLQSRVMTSITTRQVAYEKRRLEACDDIWSHSVSLQKFTALVMMLDAIGFEAGARRASTSREFCRQIASMTSTFDMEDFGSIRGEASRPYISDLAWALFSAQKAIISYAFVHKICLTTGSAGSSIRREPLIRLLKAALPNRFADIDSLDDMIGGKFLPDLSDRLLVELKRIVAGTQEDKDGIAHAAAMLVQVREVTTAMNAPGPT